MRASDAGIVAIVQGIVGNVVLADVVPDTVGGPIREGVDFHQMKGCVPLDLARATRVATVRTVGQRTKFVQRTECAAGTDAEKSPQGLRQALRWNYRLPALR
jgi:hypothetical protein